MSGLPISDEDNIRCWEYVMKYSLEEIRDKNDSEMNQLCSKYIDSKQSFIHYVEDKRRIIREKDDLQEQLEKKEEERRKREEEEEYYK
jgi:hypothetical protein